MAASSVATRVSLDQIALFAGLSDDERERLQARLRRHRYGKGEVIFLRGEPGTRLYIIESGHVKITLTSPDGREMVLALLGPKDIFGELSVLDGEPRSADAIAKEACQLLLLDRADFLSFLQEHPRVAMGVVATIARWLRHSTLLVEDAAFLDVAGRLARMLLELASSSSTASDGGTVITTRLTQAELASLVGATRESVNKWMGFYVRQGMIRYEKDLITVLLPEELRKRVL